MKVTVATASFILATVAAIPSSSHAIRDTDAPVRTLKRDPSGLGFSHVGSDRVVRSFDGKFNILDSAPLDNSATVPRSPAADVIQEARMAKERSLQQTSKPRERSVLERQEKSCVSENCPDDAYCKGLSIYGYNCTWCLMVEQGIGNCQSP